MIYSRSRRPTTILGLLRISVGTFIGRTMKSSNESWTRCSGGISGLVGLLEQKRQGRVTRRRIVSVAGLILLAGFFLTPGGFASADASQPVTCRDVHQHTEGFVAGNLDASLKERIQAHLGHCPKCVRHLDQARTKAEVVDIKSASSVVSL